MNVFGFIDYALTRPRNSPVYHFELSTEIETWLREQWAGLFRELIRSRTDRAQLASLAAQVVDLANVSETLKRYLEEVVARVGDKQEAKQIISKEEAKLSRARVLAELAKLAPITELERYNVTTEAARDVFATATSLNDLAKRIEQATAGEIAAERMVEYWKANPDMADRMNRVRQVLGLVNLTFIDRGGETTKRPKQTRRKAKSNRVAGGV